MSRLKKIFCLLLVIGLTLSNSNLSMAKSYYGNTNSNLKDYGLVAQYNSETYLVSAKPNNKFVYSDDGLWPSYSHTIYKEESNGKYLKPITDNAISGPSLNIKSGWIYYIGISGYGETGIYKVKTNGTKRTWLTSIDMHTYRGSLTQYKQMILKDNYLYYLDGPFQIKRISTAGKNRRLIYESEYYTGKFYISGDDMYVFNNTNPSYFIDSKFSIVKLKTNGTNVKRILTTTKDNYISNMLYYNGYIYYQYNDNIYRMKSNGSSKKNIIKSNTYGDINNFHIYNNKIYYIKNKILMRCNLDGSSKTTLKKSIGDFNLILSSNNKIYLNNIDDSYTIYNIKTKKVSYIIN